MGVEIRDDEITPYLESLSPRLVGEFLGRARERVGAAATEGFRAAYGASSFPYSKTGNLYASIGFRRFKDPKVVGFVAGPLKGKGRKGSHRNVVEGGTKAHRIYSSKGKTMSWIGSDGLRRYARGPVGHPGASPNPWVSRGIPGVIARAQQEFDKAVKEELA